MSDVTIDSQEKHKAFLTCDRKHALMITNHGIHQWEVMPGLPDTGGQNVFVNQFTEELARLGFKITIVNRGGYPHPLTGQWRRGLHYKDEHQRIVYLEDGVDAFVRKEDMDERIPFLIKSLEGFLDAERVRVDLILSHYWDGLKIGVLYNRTLPEPVKHVWTPHSLGALKKRSVPADQWASLRINERIAIERTLIEELDGVAATSSTIRRSLREDYSYTGAVLFLPPAIDDQRYYPREVPDDDPVWDFLSRRSGEGSEAASPVSEAASPVSEAALSVSEATLSPQELRKCKIVTEISRTVATKRKDILIEAFALVQQRVPDSLLVVSVDDNQRKLAGELRALIRSLDLRNHVAAYIPDEILPALYAITDVYCTASVMEGFGMSAQEAAASGVPIVASHLVPFVTEYLLGDEVRTAPVRKGEGAVVVQADDVNGFACALEMLLTDDRLREEMGENAYRITIPRFTWRNTVPAFLDEIGVSS